MDSSDGESLPGLTQVPSQERIAELKLRDAQELADCSGNVTCDFENFAAEFLEDSTNVSKNGNEKGEECADLFPTPLTGNEQSTASENLTEDESLLCASAPVSISHDILSLCHICVFCALKWTHNGRHCFVFLSLPLEGKWSRGDF